MSNPQAIERRSVFDGVEIRKSDNGATLRGYAARFNSVYSMGWFTEEVHRDAFKNADMTDVRVLFNHNPDNILGRTKSGTARVGVDNNGLWYEVELPKSAESVREAIERGDITQSSWGFMLRYTDQTNGDKWEKRDGKDHRILMDVKEVFDTSLVTFPANPDTSIAKRSFDAAHEETIHPPAEAEVVEEIPADDGLELEIEIALLEHGQLITNTQ